MKTPALGAGYLFLLTLHPSLLFSVPYPDSELIELKDDEGRRRIGYSTPFFCGRLQVGNCKVIRKEIIDRIRRSTAGVVRMIEKHEDALQGHQLGDKTPRLKSTTVATGFLIRNDLVLTNRHVIEQIAEEHQKVGHHKHWYLNFTYPHESGVGWSETFRRVDKLFAFIDPEGKGKLDAGILSFVGGPDVANYSESVNFGKLSSIRVGEDIAICGFPLGNELLTEGLGLFRFGPVVHRGIISAVSPFDAVESREITTFLTDLNSAPGMSGAPVFRPDDGGVIGLHYAGSPGTLGCAVPIDKKRVNGWIDFFEKSSSEAWHELQISDGGDIVA